MRPPANTGTPITSAVDVIFPRWKAEMLWLFNDRAELRFAELQRLLPPIAPSMLAQRLKELETEGFIGRVPGEMKKSTYVPTELARTLGPVFDTLVDWSHIHLAAVRANRAGRGR